MQANYDNESIIRLLDKVRIFNKSIGSYELYAITGDFDYAVKLSNGKILLKVEDLQDDELNALTPAQLTQIATRFKPIIDQDMSAIPKTPSQNAAITTQGNVKQAVPKKKMSYRALIAIAILIILGSIGFVSTKNSSADTTSSSDDVYQEKLMTVEEMERAEPTKFLSATASFNENFWGNKIKVHGVIINNATTVTFKDAVIRITYYSKTNTALGSTEHTIYEAFSPTSNVPFELKVENYKDVAQLGVEVISAGVY